jgi:uncharacterized protein YbjT (DUF2867 family)
MFAVAGVTGQTGAAVARALLDQKKSVRVLVRSEEKAAAWRARGAQVSVLNLGDAMALAAALEGVDAAYLIVPPCYESSAPNRAACRIVDGYRAALEKRPIKHLVLLSSIGAQHSDKTGLVVSCHYAEQQLSQLTKTGCTFLRSAYFMENLPLFLRSIQGHGVLPALFSPSRPLPMVSVQDVGRFSAGALAEARDTHQVVEISGPTDHSFDDVAAMFARALGTTVKAVRVPEASIVSTLTSIGIPAPTSELYREMALAVESGLVSFERGKIRHVRGGVTLEEAIRRFTT